MCNICVIDASPRCAQEKNNTNNNNNNNNNVEGGSPCSLEADDYLSNHVGGMELQQEVESATLISGFNGAFRTEFEILMKAPLSTTSSSAPLLSKEELENSINLVVEVFGGVRVLWSLKTRMRGDGELQIGVVASALTASAVGCDISMRVVPVSTTGKNLANSVRAPSYNGVVLPWQPHEKRMHQGNGLLMLYPSCNSFVGPANEEGKCKVIFSTLLTPTGNMTSTAFLRSLEMQKSLKTSSSSSSRATTSGSSSSDDEDYGGESTPVAVRIVKKKSSRSFFDVGI